MDIKLVKYSDNKPYILSYVKKHNKGKPYIRRIYGKVVRCETCDVLFFTKDRKDNRPQKYCSKKCINREQQRGHRAIGRIIKHGGYYEIMLPDYPNVDKGGRIRLHRYFMEQKIGRLLKEGEVVHHIDRDKLNNSIDNLQLMTAYDHAILHLSEKWTKTTSWYINNKRKGWVSPRLRSIV